VKRLVGITSHRISVRDDDDDFAMPHEVVSSFYVKAVAKAGAIAVLMPVLEPEDTDALHALLDRFDAIVITGGVDVDPASYGTAAEPECGPTRPQRDAHDLAVARACVERDQPTLAICRGIQVLNVALGGTLTQHIDDHMVLEQYNQKVHDIAIDPSSNLAGIFDADSYWTNSLHHQCLADLGAGVQVIARAPDGTVEAIEVEQAPNVLGVQWHPEMLRHDTGHLELFRNTFSR
jgi:putative glutamine amidotransferase